MTGTDGKRPAEQGAGQALVDQEEAGPAAEDLPAAAEDLPAAVEDLPVGAVEAAGQVETRLSFISEATHQLTRTYTN